MENNQLRENLRTYYPDGVYTIDLIRDGRRIATTRAEPLGQIGEQIILYNSQNPNCREVLVEITDIKELDIKTDTESIEWSQKEGWSVDHLMQNPHLFRKFQTTFKVVS